MVSTPFAPYPNLQGPQDVPAGATHAVIFLHGFGSDGNDLIALASPLRSALPESLGSRLAVFSPNAPDSTPQGFGRQWFSDKSWTFRDRPGIARSSDALWSYLKTIETTHGIPLAHITVLGFSQGAMLALFGVPRWPEPVGALIGCSGLAMWQEELEAATCQKPPTLLLHGLEDDVVPADQTVAAAQALESLGFPVESHLIPRLGHGINPAALAHIAVFLTQTFTQPEPEA